MEEELRGVFPRCIRKYLNEVVEEVSSKKIFLVMFQYGFGKVPILNQLTVIKSEIIPDTKESELPKISSITEGGFYL